MATIQDFMQEMAARNASDLYLSVGAPPSIKIEGETVQFGGEALDAAAMAELVDGALDAPRKAHFAAQRELSFTRTGPDGGRYRLSVYRQRGAPAIAMRYIPAHVPDLDELHLPAVLKRVVMLRHGLVLVVGASGSGKSTTLAAMIDYRNRHRTGHILTLEDPIEYVHQHIKSVVDQREIGTDTASLSSALKSALREAPDVIMIGEIRDRTTMEQALMYAETGQLCLATLHATNASQAIDRVLSFFPDGAHRQVLLDLSLNLQAVVSQRLLRGAHGGRRVPAVELLLHSPHVADLILKGEIYGLKEAMKQSLDSGMLTFEESLHQLYRQGKITLEEALDNADSRADMSLRVRLNEPLTLAEAPEHNMTLEQPAAPPPEGGDQGWVDDQVRTRRV